MAKITTYITFIWMACCVVCCKPVGRDRNISYNVIERDTVTADTVFERVNIRQSILDTLNQYVGIKELTGHNDGPVVEMFLLSANRDPADREPWCAAFITYGFKSNNLNVPQNPALSAAWFDKTHTILNKNAIRADLGGIYFNSLDRIGHIFAYTKPFDNPTPYVSTIEGNTNMQGSREGNQVANRFRLRTIVYESANWISF